MISAFKREESRSITCGGTGLFAVLFAEHYIRGFDLVRGGGGGGKRG